MNLAYLCFNRAWGGLEMKLVEIASELKRRGHSVVLIGLPDSPFLTHGAANGLDISALTPKLRYLDIVAALRIWKILRTYSVDVLTVGVSRDLSTCVLARTLGGRFALVFQQQMQFGGARRGMLHRWVYGNVDAWITLTHIMKDAVMRNTVVPEQRIQVIPVGPRMDQFDPTRASREAARSTFGFDDEDFVFGIVGRLDPQKGQEHALRALREIIDRHPRSRLLIVGDETRGEESYRAVLVTLAEDLGILNCVRFEPHTEDVPFVLAAMDVFMMPSSSETFGYVLVEAMAMALPVIATNAGGVPEIVSDGESGLLVAPSDSASLALAMERMMDDSVMRRGIATRGREVVVGRFSFDRGINSLETTYRSLIR